MPTVGWIQEGDIEAFLAGTERVADPASWAPPAPVFKCPFCEVVLGSERALQDHVADGHHVSRPILLLSGAEPPQEITIRSSGVLLGLTISNATMAEFSLGGRSPVQMPITDVAEALSGIRDGEVSLTLTNATQRNVMPVSHTYRILFRVADVNELSSVEVAFLTGIQADALSRSSIDLFLNDPRCIGPARDYAVGLAHYCLGILQKERPKFEALTTPFAQYRENYVSAKQALELIPRPLARLVTQTVRFALNDFTFGAATGNWELDLTTTAFRDPNGSLPPKPNNGERRAVYPIDHGTGQIFDLASRMFLQERWSIILDEECRRAADSPALDATDREKALAVWAISAWRLDSREHAVEPLKRLSATYPFRVWAEPFLETVTQ